MDIPPIDPETAVTSVPPKPPKIPLPSSFNGTWVNYLKWRLEVNLYLAVNGPYYHWTDNQKIAWCMSFMTQHLQPLLWSTQWYDVNEMASWSDFLAAMD
jgi:hypothetical protein